MATPNKRHQTKDPDETLDFKIDWSDWLTESPSDNDTITSSSWIVPSGITEVDTSNDTTSATIWISGGTDNTDYEITNRVVTAGGRTADCEIMIRVRQP
jgi:hypothetical protein